MRKSIEKIIERLKESGISENTISEFAASELPARFLKQCSDIILQLPNTSLQDMISWYNNVPNNIDPLVKYYVYDSG